LVQSMPETSKSMRRLVASSWPAALIGIAIIKTVLSLAVKPGPFVVSYSAISYLLLLLLGICFVIRNGIQDTLGGRLFWALLAVAYGLWGAHQGLTLYYELVLRVEVPDNSIADSLLFPSGVSSKAAKWGQFKTGQRKWPGTVRCCTRS